MTATLDKEIDKQITNIFVTIDNYGTAQEARADIKALIAQEVKKARLEVITMLAPYIEKLERIESAEQRKDEARAVKLLFDKFFKEEEE